LELANQLPHPGCFVIVELEGWNGVFDNTHPSLELILDPGNLRRHGVLRLALHSSMEAFIGFVPVDRLNEALLDLFSLGHVMIETDFSSFEGDWVVVSNWLSRK
jgi:hypothetical protein